MHVRFLNPFASGKVFNRSGLPCWTAFRLILKWLLTKHNQTYAIEIPARAKYVTKANFALASRGRFCCFCFQLMLGFSSQRWQTKLHLGQNAEKSAHETEHDANISDKRTQQNYIHKKTSDADANPWEACSFVRSHSMSTASHNVVVDWIVGRPQYYVMVDNHIISFTRSIHTLQDAITTAESINM